MKIDNKSLNFTIFCTWPLLAFSSIAHADNYMRSEGEGYYSAGILYDTAYERWNQDSKRSQMPCTANNLTLTQAYEYGLSYYNTVFGSLEYLDRSCGINDASGVGNLTLGI